MNALVQRGTWVPEHRRLATSKARRVALLLTVLAIASVAVNSVIIVGHAAKQTPSEIAASVGAR